jgi:hypothetical protein
VVVTGVSGPLALHLNGGYGLDRYALEEDRLEHARDVWQASLAAQAELWSGLTAVGDLGLTTSHERATHRPALFGLAGLILALGPDLDLDLGLKVGRFGQERTVALLGGLTARR